jgi:hypothetical protein
MIAGMRVELERRQRPRDAPRDVGRRQSQRSRAERDVVLERPGEELLVGVPGSSSNETSASA